MPYERKTRDVYELQADHGYGHGWECETAETTRTEIRTRLREYRENCPGLPLRVVTKREPINAVTQESTK